MYQIGWFSTGRDPAARDLLKTVQQSIQQGEIKAEICFVFSNREPGENRESDLFFQLVKSYGIPLLCLSHRKFKASREGDALARWREEYDRAVMKLLERFQPDLCVLAGYMLIVGEEMCRNFTMINLHPAAPGGPRGTWQEVIWDLIEHQAQCSGVMMHLVTPELDRGPVVTYCTFAIRGEPFDSHWREIERRPIAEIKAAEGESNPLFQLLRQQGLSREFPLIIATIKAFSEGRVKIEAGRVIDAQGKPLPGYDLSREIDALISSRRKERLEG
jgi:folate-dependent phosphoribosylglycinamide formyltransferase PurN